MIGMMEENTPPPVAAKTLATEKQNSKLSPAEMRIKKYHKKNGSVGPSFERERSKSTPDLADMDFSGDGEVDFFSLLLFQLNCYFFVIVCLFVVFFYHF